MVFKPKMKFQIGVKDSKYCHPHYIIISKSAEMFSGANSYPWIPKDPDIILSNRKELRFGLMLHYQRDNVLDVVNYSRNAILTHYVMKDVTQKMQFYIPSFVINDRLKLMMQSKESSDLALEMLHSELRKKYYKWRCKYPTNLKLDKIKYFNDKSPNNVRRKIGLETKKKFYDFYQ